MLALGAERIGWKIGLGIVPGDEELEPVLGYLTSATRLRPGGVYRAGATADLRLHAELALEIGADGRPARYGAALELVDVARPPDDYESIVAGNLWHRAFALSPLRQQPALELVRAEVRVDGQAAGEAEARVDPVEAVRIASDLLTAVGERLEPGDRIMAGSIVQVPIEPDAEVVADLGELGVVGVKVR